MDLSIAISSFNRNDKVLETLKSICESEMYGVGSVDVIVIDDGSPRPVAPLVEKLESVPDNVRIRVITQANAGIGPTRNRGFRESANDLVLFLDDDIILKKDSLQKIVGAATEERCGIVFGSYPFVTHASESLRQFASKFYGYDRLTSESAFEYIDGIASGFLWVTKSKVGELDELYRDDLRIPAAEEHELIYRFNRTGQKIAHARHISAIHNHHLDLQWIAEQQYKYGLATAEAFEKYPGIDEMTRYAELKRTLEGRDGVRSWFKDLASTGFGRKLALTFATLVQKVSPQSNHDRVFAAVTTTHFRGGYKDGLRNT